MSGVRVGALIGEQDGGQETCLTGGDGRQQALGERPVDQGARFDGAHVPAAQGGGGQRQFEVFGRVVRQRDGAHGQGWNDLEERGFGQDAVVLESPVQQGRPQRRAHGQRVDRQHQMAVCEIRQADAVGGGPVAGEGAAACDGHLRAGHRQPAQREPGMEFRCVAAQLAVIEIGAGAGGRVDGVVMTGGEGVEGESGAPGPGGRAVTVLGDQRRVGAAACGLVQAHGGSSLVAFRGEGDEAGSVGRVGEIRERAEDFGGSAQFVIAWRAPQQRQARRDITQETVGRHRNQHRSAVIGVCQSQPGPVRAGDLGGLGAQAADVLAQHGRENP